MLPASASKPVTFCIQQGKTSLTIQATSFADLLDNIPVTKTEMAKQWGLNGRTYDKRRLFPGTITQSELHTLAVLLGVPYLDIARLIYEQCQSNSSTEEALPTEQSL